jgi:hypothetical protein
MDDDDIMDLTVPKRKKTGRRHSARNREKEVSPYDHSDESKEELKQVPNCKTDPKTNFALEYPCKKKRTIFRNNKQHVLQMLTRLLKPVQTLQDLLPELYLFVDELVALVEQLQPSLPNPEFDALFQEALGFVDKFSHLFETLKKLDLIRTFIYSADDGSTSDLSRRKDVVFRDMKGLRTFVAAVQKINLATLFFPSFSAFLKKVHNLILSNHVRVLHIPRQFTFVQRATMEPFDLAQLDDPDLAAPNYLPERRTPTMDEWFLRFGKLLAIVEQKVATLNYSVKNTIVDVLTNSQKKLETEKKLLGPNKTRKQARREWKKGFTLRI